jgi:hypothetical protein
MKNTKYSTPTQIKVMKLTHIGNRIASLFMVIAFFGIYPRELQEQAPTIFVLLSMLIYSINKHILNKLLIKHEERRN